MTPRYRDLPEAPDGGRSAWQFFGPDDSLGRIGLQAPEAVRAAAALVRDGRVFALNAPHTLLDPPLFGRGAVRHHLLGRREAVDFDDVFDNYYPQASSQWDSLAHIAYSRDVYYQGRTADDVVERQVDTIEHWARRGIAGRGVLLDVRRSQALDGDDYDPGASRAITVAELDRARERAGVEFAEGDVLLIRTGYLGWYAGLTAAQRRELAPVAGFTAVGIDRSEAMAEYLWDSGVVACAGDNPALEVWPPDRAAGPFGFLHRVLIAQLGFAIGELWQLDALADDCAADGRYEFLLTSAPLNVPGGVGSPANALALK